ncbi:MAG: hypothetical protein ACK5XO_11995 [Phycisphaerales bacterium]
MTPRNADIADANPPRRDTRSGPSPIALLRVAAMAMAGLVLTGMVGCASSASGNGSGNAGTGPSEPISVPVTGPTAPPEGVSAPTLDQIPLASERSPLAFQLAVTVLPATRGRTSESDPAALRRGQRYVMEADRVLRSAEGPAAGRSAFPGRTRQLTREQAADLWDVLLGSEMGTTLSRRLVAGDAEAHPGLVGSLAGRTFAPDRATVLVWVHADGAARQFALTGEDAGDALVLVERLSELSWPLGSR